MPDTLFEGKVFSEYAQFHLTNSGATWTGDMWTPEANAAHIAAFNGGVAVGTATKHGDVRVLVERHHSTPDLDEADQVAEAPLEVWGRLLLSSIRDEFEIGRIPNGRYTLRVLSFHVAEGVEVGDGGDSYVLQLFGPGSSSVRLLRASTAWPR